MFKFQKLELKTTLFYRLRIWEHLFQNLIVLQMMGKYYFEFVSAPEIVNVLDLLMSSSIPKQGFSNNESYIGKGKKYYIAFF